MANRYWVATGTTGGNGVWTDTQNWASTSGGTPGVSVPGSGDTVVFTSIPGNVTCTLNISPDIQSLNCTGFTGTLAFGTNTISLNTNGTVFTGSTTMTVTGTPLIILTSPTTATRNVVPTTVTEANSISFRITQGTGTLSFSTGAVRDLDFTDGTNPTGFAGAMGTSTLIVYGSFKASTGMTKTAGTGTFTFAATSGTKTINTAGVTFDNPFTFNGVGGTWQLQSALTSGDTRTVTLSNGTVDLNGYTLTTGLFSSNNSNVRTLAFGSGKIVLTNNGGTLLSMTTATNFSYTGTSRIECIYSGSIGTRTLIPPGTNAVESNALNVYITAGTDTVTVSGACRFLTFDLTGFSGTLNFASNSRYFGNLVFSSGMTLGTVSGSFTFAKTSGTQTIISAGKTMSTSITVDAPGATVSLQDALSLTDTLTLTNGIVNTNGYAVTAGEFSSSNTNARTLNLGVSLFTITNASWNTATVTNLTTDATGTISMSSASAKTFAGGGRTWGKLINSGAGALTITGANTFMELGNSVSPTSFVFPASTTTSAYAYSINGTASNLVSLRSSTPGTQYTLAKL